MCMCIWSDDDGVAEDSRSAQEVPTLNLCAHTQFRCGVAASACCSVLGLWKLVSYRQREARGNNVRNGETERCKEEKGMRRRKNNLFIYLNVGNWHVGRDAISLSGRSASRKSRIIHSERVWQESPTQYQDPTNQTCLDGSLSLRTECSPALGSSHSRGWAWVIQPRFQCPCEMQDTPGYKLQMYRELLRPPGVTQSTPLSASGTQDLPL